MEVRDVERFSMNVTFPRNRTLTLAGYRSEVRAPRGCVCIVHGVGEHFPRYQELAEHLNRRGYSVYGMDLPGHGESPGQQGYLGPREGVGPCITALRKEAARRAMGAPIFLFGHSMGGLLVLTYRHYFPDCGIRGFLTCSPWLGLTFHYSEEELEQFRELSSENPYAKLRTAVSPKKLFTLEPGRVIPRDDKLHPFIAYANLLERLDDIKLVFQNAGEPRAPLYIMAGADDPICDVSEIERYARQESRQCTLQVWPGMKHEPWNEPGRAQVVDHMADWLDRQL